MLHGSEPLIVGLIVGLVLGALIEILIVLGPGRYFIAKKARKENLDSLEAGEWDPALDRALTPIKKQITQEIATLKADLTTEDASQEFEAFEERFNVAYTADMLAIQEEIKTIPRRISGIIHAGEGNEEKAFRAMVVDAEAEVEGEISLMEATVSQDPRAMQVAIAQKIQKLGGDPEWQEEHPIGAVLLEIAKPQLMGWIQTAAGQMTGMTPTLAAKSRTSNLYGI